MNIVPDWKRCKNVLCIRADNMGDLLMSSPAIRNLKEALDCKVTVLTSEHTAALVPFLPGIDAVITADLPWINTGKLPDLSASDLLLTELRANKFDGCVIFTVYSQSPLPAAYLCYLAGIPLVLAYCRENPYGLINHWVPETEPYNLLRNQVQRDLDLVSSIGILINYQNLHLKGAKKAWPQARSILEIEGVELSENWIIFHVGVSEEKRKFNADLWVLAARRMVLDHGCQVLVTGLADDKELSDEICARVGPGAFSMAGKFSLPEFIALLDHAHLIVSVNTSTIHLAAALNKVQVVLYALTNPQHLPWKGRGTIIPFPVPAHLKSRNEVVRYADAAFFKENTTLPETDELVDKINSLLNGSRVPELFPNVLNQAFMHIIYEETFRPGFER